MKCCLLTASQDSRGRPLRRGHTDPNGNPCCLRESVERLPSQPRYPKVCAQRPQFGYSPRPSSSASLPSMKTFLCSHLDSTHNPGILLLAGPLEQSNTSRIQQRSEQIESN